MSVHSATIFYEGMDRIKEIQDEYFDRTFDFAEGELGEEFDFHRIVETSPPAGLTKVAEEIDSDLVIVGSSSRGPIGRVLVGDVGARVASGAPCPVAVVPRGWGQKETSEFERIGVAFNGTFDAEEALLCGAELARQFEAALCVIGVVPEVINPRRIASTDPGYQKVLSEEMEKGLARAVTRTGIAEAEAQVRVGYASDEIARESSALDLLILGSRGYGPIRRVLLGGTSLKVVRSAACPVIVVPRSGD
ncbi:MAG: universal stress protein [Solirubrobacterales bacterium]|nr:universal stress protein [Solirubrobacterales bacterium]